MSMPSAKGKTNETHIALGFGVGTIQRGLLAGLTGFVSLVHESIGTSERA